MSGFEQQPGRIGGPAQDPWAKTPGVSQPASSPSATMKPAIGIPPAPGRDMTYFGRLLPSELPSPAPASAKAPAKVDSVALVATVPSIGVASPQGGEIHIGTRANPIQGQPPSVSPQEGAHQTADKMRHQQMQEAHQAIMSMAKGKNGQYGNLMNDSVPFSVKDNYGGASGYQNVPGEGLHKAMAAMQAHYAALAQGDAHEHGAQLQFGGDIRHDPAYRAAQIGHVNAQAAHGNAQAAALDPVAEESRLKRIMADPTLRAAYEAKIGVAPGTIPVPPMPTRAADGTEQPAYHAGNAEQGLARPENSGLSAIINDPNMPFHEKLARASQIPDFANPASPTRQLFNAHMHQLFPTQQSWQAHRESHVSFR